jgi:hypothetical protein
MPYVTSAERIGMERGVEKGRSEGVSQGLIQGRLEGIAVALRIKFHGRGDALLPEIREIQSLQKLNAILHAIDGATEPDDLRAIWAD